VRAIPFRKALALGCVLVLALSWAFVLNHLLTLLPGGGFDASAQGDCPAAQQASLVLRPGAESHQSGDCCLVEKGRAGPCHDRDRCGICSLARAKTLSWSSQYTHDVTILGAVAFLALKPSSLHYAVAGSIRAPPAPLHPV
jgi:hypothetical protein